MKKLLLITLLLSVPTLSCSQESVFDSNAEKITKLGSRIEALESEIKKIHDELPLIRGSIIAVAEHLPAKIFLTPSTENFRVLNPDLGQIVASFRNLKAYASGTEFSIGFVNTASVALTNVEFEAKVSSMDDKIKSADTVSKRKGISLPAGQEVKVTFRVPEIKPENFKNVSISAFIGGITFKAGK